MKEHENKLVAQGEKKKRSAERAKNKFEKTIFSIFSHGAVRVSKHWHVSTP